MSHAAAPNLSYGRLVVTVLVRDCLATGHATPRRATSHRLPEALGVEGGEAPPFPTLHTLRCLGGEEVRLKVPAPSARPSCACRNVPVLGVGQQDDCWVWASRTTGSCRS